MKKFRFNLEKVLNIRAWAEEEARAALGRAVSALAALDDALRKNEAERLRIRAEDFTGAGLASSLQALSDYRLRLEQEKERLLQERVSAQQAVDEATRVWRETAAEKKVMENLKDRRSKEHKKANLAAEDQIMDEIAQNTGP